MNKIMAMVFLFLTGSPALHAQWVSRNYGADDLRAVQFFANCEGYVVGKNGFMAKLTNCGEAISPLANLPFRPSFLSRLYFLNQQTGWVVGASGAIFKTTNGGGSWIDQTFNSTIILNACHFLTQNGLMYGWVGGTNNLIYSTANGGTAWQLANTGISGTVLDIYFRDSSNGYCATTSGIFYTTDGERWQNVPSGINATFTGFFATSPTTAWAVGFGGNIFRSSSLPGNWRDVKPAGLSTNLNDVFALSDNEAYVVGRDGLVLHTTQAGANWEMFNLGNKLLLAVFANDKDNIWIAGEGGANYYSEGTVAFGANPIIINERLEVDKTREITFAAQFNSTVDLELSTNNGTSWSAIPRATGLAVGLGKFDWFVSNTPSTSCKLRLVSSKKRQVQAVSPVFEIFQKTLTLQEPHGGEILPGGSGSRFFIKWTHANVQNVNLWLQIKQKLDSVKIADNISASTLEFNWPVPPGINSNECRVRIFETDGSPAVASNLFAITFDPDAPVVDVDTSQIKPQKEKALTITATITDDNPTIASLFYRQGGDLKYRNQPLTLIAPGSKEYHATISGREGEGFIINERGLEFYIKATDTSPAANIGVFGTEARPIYLPVKIDTLKHEIRRSDPGDDIYQMIAMPYKLNDARLSSVLENDLGNYDHHKWRLWTWRNDADGYGEFTKVDIGQFTQGKSFWIAASKDKFFSEAGQSYKPETINIKLEKGWNQIGHPFAFPVRKKDIFAATRDTADLSPIYGYNDQWQPVTQLETGKGYFVKNTNLSGAERILKIPPIAATGTTGALMKAMPQAGEWQVKLRAQSGRFVDDYNLLGASKTAAPEWDYRDEPEPPPVIGKYLSLYFPHQEWRARPDLYTTDFRPASTAGEIWNFIIATNILNSSVTIYCKGVESIPEELQIYLIDDRVALSQNLRQNPEYSFPTAGRPMKKELQLAIGNAEFFQARGLRINNTPSHYELAQNFPNPFWSAATSPTFGGGNAATAIRFGLPAAGLVTLKVYDLLGQEVAVLLDGVEKEAGYHLQIWNGQDKAGKVARSGVYFYRLHAGKFSKTRKMLFMQ